MPKPNPLTIMGPKLTANMAAARPRGIRTVIVCLSSDSKPPLYVEIFTAIYLKTSNANNIIMPINMKLIF